MRDEGVVKRTAGELAEILVQSREACAGCASRALCSLDNKGTALLQALNPLAAQPGDLVEIEVPENAYARQLITMFGVFLLGVVAGTGVGAWLASALSLSTNSSAALGFFVGLTAAGLFNWVYFHKAKHKTFPVIIAILTHGGLDG